MIVFDLDDTLIDTSGVITPFKLREFLSFLICNQVDVGIDDDAMQEMLAFDQQCSSSKDTIRFCLERYRAVHLYEQATIQFFAPLPKNFIVSLTPNAKNVLQILKDRGYLLALVTGGSPSYQMEKLEKAGLEPSIFSKISVAENSQKKPHYEAIVQEFRQPPREMIAVGDRIQMDLLPAHELGWRTVHMCWGRGKIGKPANWVDHSIPELSKLLEIV